MARGDGRWKAVAIVGGLGILLVIAGIGIAGAAIARLVVRRRRVRGVGPSDASVMRSPTAATHLQCRCNPPLSTVAP